MFRSVIPTLRVKDASRSETFFRALGFQLVWDDQENPDSPRFLEMRRNRTSVFLSEHAGDGPFGISLYFVVQNAEELYAELQGKDITLAEQPYLTEWEHMVFEITDPDGNTLNFGSPVKPRPRRSKAPSTRSPRADGSSPDNPKTTRDENRPVAPTKTETALLPAFPGVDPEHIHVPGNPAECEAAVDEIFAAGVAGFDTEAKPTFRVGEQSGGPHVVQFSLTDRAFIFQLHRKECRKAASDLIASRQVMKVGFGLKNDRKQIRDQLGVQLNHVLDLDQIFRKLGYRGQIGVRGAMGALLNLNFPKSKSVTTSNWAAADLTPRQLLYAANDAFAALKIMEALQREGHLEE